MKVNEFIALYRKMKGHTQDTLALKINVSPNTLSQYETGTRNIPQDILKSLCETLDFSIIYLPRKKTVISIEFEREALENLLHLEIKKNYNINLSFSVENEEEYPENLLIYIYEEENNQKELKKVENEFGEDIFSPHTAADFLLCDLFNSRDVTFWNENKGEMGKFQTIIQIPL